MTRQWKRAVVGSGLVLVLFMPMGWAASPDQRLRTLENKVGSCVISVRCEVTDAHPPNQMGCDPFDVDHSFIRRDVEVQVLLMHAPKGPQIRPECRPSSLARVAVHLTSTIAVIIPCPLVHAMTDGAVGRMAPPITLPLVGIEPRAASWHVLRDQGGAGAPVRMVAHPKTLLPRLARDHTDDGWAIIGRGAVSLPFMRASAWRIAGVTMRRTFFPRRSGRVHRPQRQCRPSYRWALSRSS